MRLKEVYTIKEVAQALKCTVTTVRTYYREGRIHTIRIGRNFKVTEDEIKYILAHGLHEVSDDYRKEARRKRAVTRARAKARAAAQNG